MSAPGEFRIVLHGLLPWFAEASADIDGMQYAGPALQPLC
jgi:hypothetical protein